MAFGTMSLAGFPRGEAIASQNILARSHRLKMCRIHTSAVAAEMIGLEASRNRANQVFIGETMSLN